MKAGAKGHHGSRRRSLLALERHAWPRQNDCAIDIEHTRTHEFEKQNPTAVLSSLIA
jgi:hypothetical protein